ncbi:MAG TPA: tetratricopeptide repeat protein [Vicinamibacterales bacterium]|nr:tetratricopeptide repeat protein [Vicinamibacterales bacterium]
MTASVDRPFAGEQVALVGRLSLLSKRDTRSIVERLGGIFSSDLTPGTTVVVSGQEDVLIPAHVRRVISESDLCLAAGLPDPETLRARYYSARDLRNMYPALRDDHLRYLGKWGLVRPIAGRYSFADLHVIRQTAAEIERGVSLNSVLRTLAAEQKGQLTFDFQPARQDRTPARVVSLPTPPPADMTLFPTEKSQQLSQANHSLAAKYFLEGAELDDGEARDLDTAAANYRRAVLFDPQLVPAIVNLANIHYERDELVEAEALYEKAIRVDAECFEAYFNLGNIHHDVARYLDAVSAYREALAINPAYPEAHFYLAVTLEKLGRATEAKPHWKQYRDLAPDGEFVELAKEFSD